nr:hypothetical protein BaRGS_001107 [Batillaria attramentaria]
MAYAPRGAKGLRWVLPPPQPATSSSRHKWSFSVSIYTTLLRGYHGLRVVALRQGKLLVVRQRAADTESSEKTRQYVRASVYVRYVND